MDVLHTAIWVHDVDRQLAFYREVLGLDHSRDFVGDDGVQNVFVTGASNTEIQFKAADEADDDIDPSGIDHLAVQVEDVEATIETAVDEWGSEVPSGPVDVAERGIRIAFITDPAGYLVEVIEER